MMHHLEALGGQGWMTMRTFHYNDGGDDDDDYDDDDCGDGDINGDVNGDGDSDDGDGKYGMMVE